MTVVEVTYPQIVLEVTVDAGPVLEVTLPVAAAPGGGGGGVTDGDKGDITVSGSGATWTIDGGAVSLSKMADLATSTILGRATAGTGVAEALTPSQVRSILNVADGATANASDAALRDRSTHTGTQAVGTITGLAAVATSGSASDLGTGTLPIARIADGAITLAKMASIAAAMILGNNTGGAAAPIALTAAQVKTLLNLTGTNSGDQTITLTGDVTGSGTGSFAATIAADAVTNAKLANVATATIKGRATAGTGDPEDLTGTQATALLDTFTSGAKGLVPASGGGTSNFLRADGTFAAPPGGGGSPGGLSGEVQYNNGGAFAGAADVAIEGGQLRLPAISTPTSPAADGLKLFGRKLGGRVLPAFISPSGLDSSLQPHLGGNRVLFVSPTSGTTAPSTVGGNVGTAGTLSFQQTFGSSNRWLSTARKRATTTATAGNAASIRQAYTNWMRGSAAGFGGFFFRAQFGVNINLNGSQLFVGLCPATGALGGDPSTDFPLNMCGMGWDAADASTGNWYFFRNDGAGSPVKVDLGATHAARAVDVGWELVMFMAPGGSELFVQITNLNTGANVLTTSYTTDIPAADTGLCLKCDVRNGAVASACNIEFAKIYIESDY